MPQLMRECGLNSEGQKIAGSNTMDKLGLTAGFGAKWFRVIGEMEDLLKRCKNHAADAFSHRAG